MGAIRLRFSLALALGLTVWVAAAAGVEAAEFDFDKFFHEFGIRLVGGKNDRSAAVRLYGAMPRFGWVLLKPGNPCFGGLGLTFVLEGVCTVAQAERGGGEIGLTPLLKLSLPLARKALLFVEGGAGLIGELFDSPAVPHRLNFTPQVGAGVEVAIRPQLAFTAAYRFRHSSNASLYAENPAFDVHFVQVGLTSYF